MVSIIIPSYRSPYLNKTIDSLLKSAEREIEVIPVVDGYIPELIKNDSRVKPIYLDVHKGMRNAINTGITKSTGEFIMKCDDHCIFGEGYDKILTSYPENWLMIPRRYSIIEEGWKRNDLTLTKDYHYISFPKDGSFSIVPWYYTKREAEIDDTMTFQGSCWLANKKYFMEHVGLLDDRPETYGSFIQEQTEIGLKYWLGGGEIKVNKKTWYAHLGKRMRHYSKRMFSKKHKTEKEVLRGNRWGTKHWMNNEEPNMVHPFSWIVEKFWPIPYWEDNWEEIWKKYNSKHPFVK